VPTGWHRRELVLLKSLVRRAGRTTLRETLAIDIVPGMIDAERQMKVLSPHFASQLPSVELAPNQLFQLHKRHFWRNAIVRARWIFSEQGMEEVRYVISDT
jgi:hypothetical protein